MCINGKMEKLKIETMVVGAESSWRPKKLEIESGCSNELKQTKGNFSVVGIKHSQGQICSN